MNVVVIARSLNEEDNIATFCKQYDFADHILISDSKSTDRTVEIAKTFPKVQVDEFDNFIPLKKGKYITHQPKHINHLIDWAKTLNPDWIIFDDIDDYPNKHLKESARKILEDLLPTHINLIHLYRVYLYLDDFYFPDMNKAGKSRWAWNPSKINVFCDEHDYKEQNMFAHGDKQIHELDIPLVCLHNFAPSEEKILEKMRLYSMVGKPQLHPEDGCGEMADRPDWASI